MIMKKIATLLLSAAILILLISIGSCTKEPAPLQDYLVQVDSIHVSDTVTAGEPFDIEFYGTIGFDMCHSFKVFNQSVNGNNISIQTWGTFDNSAEACPEALVLLDGQKLSMTLKIPGIYNLLIVEPAAYSLKKQIVVK